MTKDKLARIVNDSIINNTSITSYQGDHGLTDEEAQDLSHCIVNDIWEYIREDA